MADEAQDNKTEPATPFKRNEARKKGRVAQSNEIGRSLVFLAGVLILWATGPRILTSFAQYHRDILGHLRQPDLNTLSASKLFSDTCFMIFIPLAPAVTGMAVVAAVAGLAQVGIFATTETLVPKPEKLNPFTGVQKLFSLRSIVMLTVSLLKISAVLLISWITVRSYLPMIMNMGNLTPLGIGGAMVKMGLDLSVRAGLVLVLIAAIDYAYQKWQYERDLRMSKQDVKDEQKMTEGNPEIQSRIRRVQYAMARTRMMADVKKADVIIRNPTHFAVALKYDPKEHSAPTVLAKGKDLLAKRIIEIAMKHKIMMVHEPPLAQALYKTVQVGQLIPPKLYRAVAKILVHVMKAKRNRR